jgi:hypothetical protein
MNCAYKKIRNAKTQSVICNDKIANKDKDKEDKDKDCK